MSDLVKARRLVAEIVADREEGTEDAWWHSNVSDFVLDESYGEHGGQNGADRRRILRVPAVERALIAALDLTAVDELEAENKRLREALAFYANPSAWNQKPVETVETVIGTAYRNEAAEMQKDRGARARAALNEADNARLVRLVEAEDGA